MILSSVHNIRLFIFNDVGLRGAKMVANLGIDLFSAVCLWTLQPHNFQLLSTYWNNYSLMIYWFSTFGAAIMKVNLNWKINCKLKKLNEMKLMRFWDSKF